MKGKIILRGLLLCSTAFLLGGCANHEKDKTTATSSSSKPKTVIMAPQPKKPTNIQSQLTPEEANQLSDYLNKIHFSGTILLVKNNKPVYANAYGYANKKENKKNTVDSAYQIASVQKFITATAILKLIEEGKLSFADRLSQFYPDFPHGDQITIRQLLNMDSGLHLPNDKRPNKVYSSQDGYIKYYADTATFYKSKKWNYEAVNYSILAGILEKVTHRSYEKAVDDMIIKPLKLTNIGFVNAKHQPSNYSMGHNLQGADSPYVEKEYQYAREVGTGNMYSSAPTLYKLMSSIIQGKIISPELFTQTHISPSGRRKYESGCYVQPTTYMSHGGGLGFDASVVISKDGKNAVIMLCNQAYKQYMPNLANQIYEQLMNWTPQNKKAQ